MQLKWACFPSDSCRMLQRFKEFHVTGIVLQPGTPGGECWINTWSSKRDRLLLAFMQVFSIFTPLHHHPPLLQPFRFSIQPFFSGWDQHSGYANVWGLPGFTMFNGLAGTSWWSTGAMNGQGFVTAPPPHTHKLAVKRVITEYGPGGGSMLMLAHCGTDYAFMGESTSQKMQKICCPHTGRPQRGSAEVKLMRKAKKTQRWARKTTIYVVFALWAWL